ncbi:hypothetical protein [Hymenobacter glacieicola]|uniref:Uncharacterized protein n=1 Tax=Hymenobacter glacieicola TaxID=1562124 RepID=A0ABQ1WKA7_9BACT|nr:hypothetical protein [Hymenobacter glacieicola]GGG34226.1 hypothetical protein GCM10011378_08300 [Hymenobacter glacieicola]
MAAAYNEELLSRVQTWLGYSYSKRHTRENTAELHALYAAITGGSAEGCTNCNYDGYVGLLEAYERQSLRFLHPELMPESNYTLAPGFENETFVHESYSKAVTADTLTDEAAEFFISKGYGHAFVKKEGAETKSEAPKLTEKQQLQAEYKDLFAQDADEALTIPKLKEAIAAKKAELDQQD